MDPRTAYVVLSLMMLASSGALALFLRDMPDRLRSPVRSWQAGTLLIAAGYLCYAFPSLPLPVMVTMANGGILVGLTICWRGVQQFDGQRQPPWHFLPAALGTFAIFWFSAIQPDTLTRILSVSLASAAIMGGCMVVLVRRNHRDGSLSRLMLAALFGLVVALNLTRFGFYAWIGIPPDFSIADRASGMNVVSPLVAAVLPVLGTMFFTLMCAERVRRHWERVAATDDLTGLPNRRSLTEAGRHRFEAARLQRENVAIALIDIDSFKSINDCYGHEAGDMALRHVANCLTSAMEPGELLARTGGEEFVALLEEAEMPQAQRAAEDLRAVVQQHPFRLKGALIPLTVSVGIAVSQTADRDFDGLLRRADKAMYAAKSGGRNRVELAA